MRRSTHILYSLRPSGSERFLGQFLKERTMAPAAKAAKKDGKPNAGFMKPVTPSSALAAVIGAEAVPRTEITKKVWDYIKANKLQDESNKRNINADAKLQAVFDGKKQVTMFEMTKLISAHLK